MNGRREIGRRGDFFTSVSVGPVFGEMLAFQFAQWLEEIAPPPAPGGGSARQTARLEFCAG